MLEFKNKDAPKKYVNGALNMAYVHYLENAIKKTQEALQIYNNMAKNTEELQPLMGSTLVTIRRLVS